MVSQIRIGEKPRKLEDGRWRRNLQSSASGRRRTNLAGCYSLLAVSLLGAAAGLLYFQPSLVPFQSVSAALFGSETVSKRFSICGAGTRVTCVVDGDTFWLEGVKIRIADFDTPEVSDPHCETEALLGARATRRLLTLLNAGPFQLARSARDEDRYGRKLRVVLREGRSIGEILVAEGLAHRWVGRKQSWCG